MNIKEIGWLTDKMRESYKNVPERCLVYLRDMHLWTDGCVIMDLLLETSEQATHIKNLEAENKRLWGNLKGIRKCVKFIGYASTNKDEVDERVIELKGFIDALSKDK